MKDRQLAYRYDLMIDSLRDTLITLEFLNRESKLLGEKEWTDEYERMYDFLDKIREQREMIGLDLNRLTR